MTSTIASAAELRDVIGSTTPVVQLKISDSLNDLTRQFIERSPFMLLATSSTDGTCDVSPRGDPPGFDRRLWLSGSQFEHVPDEVLLIHPQSQSQPANRRGDEALLGGEEKRQGEQAADDRQQVDVALCGNVGNA